MCTVRYNWVQIFVFLACFVNKGRTFSRVRLLVITRFINDLLVITSTELQGDIACILNEILYTFIFYHHPSRIPKHFEFWSFLFFSIQNNYVIRKSKHI